MNRKDSTILIIKVIYGEFWGIGWPAGSSLHLNPKYNEFSSPDSRKQVGQDFSPLRARHPEQETQGEPEISTEA